MSDHDRNIEREEPVPGRLNEKTVSAVVRGVFWFGWLTARYRKAAEQARQIENQRAEWN